MPTPILATGGYDHTIRFWEAHSGVCKRTIQYPDSQVNKLEITPDKQYLAAAGNPHIRFFEINTNNNNPVTSFDGHTSNVTSLGFQKEGKWMYSASEDGTLKIWDVRTPGCQREYENKTSITTVALHPNQGEIVFGDQLGNVRVWDLAMNKCSRDFKLEGDSAVRSLSLSQDASMMVAANNKGMCFMWRMFRSQEGNTDFEPVQRLEAHKTYVLKALISPDGRSLVTASADHTVKLWRIERGVISDRSEKVLSGHQRWVWDCVFSVDSAYLVTVSSDYTGRLWDISQGDTIRHYTGHHKAVVCVALSDT
eukprot:TRINITY_DN5079_c0_g2_i1.p1 TRINITY_DN5079_c0_g2~~TRINITY_DN5079_c0_g2_i1.p1  ORF type:complete len:309 (-),score=55.25 TRINITY_DN5079_c0_g2_i1:1623-2549(-)